MCDRLYRESIDRTRRTKAKQLAYEQKIQRESCTTTALRKSSKIVYEKVAKDIGKVMELVDQQRSGYMNVKQMG